MTVYYNEIDLYAAQWLRNLITAGLIAPGVVDTRSIEDVRPSDLTEFTQCHFFAGIGIWSYALRSAGWTDDRPVWTGSCPCQPFSSAGQGAAFADERHLWPAFHHLIKERRPEHVFGEQVASKDADPWIDLVQDDMEALGYPFGAVPFPSSSIGAPHIRDRTYWAAGVAQGDASSKGLERHARNGGAARRKRPPGSVAASSVLGRMADDELQQRPNGVGTIGHEHDAARRQQSAAKVTGLCGADGLANGQGERCGEARPGSGRSAQRPGDGGEPVWMDNPDSNGTQWKGRAKPGSVSRREPSELVVIDMDSGIGTGPTNGYWQDSDWLFCRDGKWRPVEGGTFPLANGDPSRVGSLRAYGNAINAQQARIFIETVMEYRP